MPDSRYVVETIGGMPVVVAPREIDIGNAAELRAALLRAVAMGQPIIAVDLSTTEFCDSAGLAVLVRARRLAIAEGKELRLVVSTPQVMRILSVTGLDRWFLWFRTRAEATSDSPAAADRCRRDETASDDERLATIEAPPPPGATAVMI
ncbi:MAG TPA: STAS domain-containing protein [Streptosporangiaceae bacterium]|jgi:anti-sigma B factor antagonist|nr:STAS domain-containing protein [Streptosporangiaceae bacterium]